jgi:MFS superfamily sulfate permease-like transporter
VHIVFVYGHLSILPKHQQTIPEATLGIVIITAAMTLLAVVRLSWKRRGAEFTERVRSIARAKSGN